MHTSVSVPELTTADQINGTAKVMALHDPHFMNQQQHIDFQRKFLERQNQIYNQYLTQV